LPNQQSQSTEGKTDDDDIKYKVLGRHQVTNTAFAYQSVANLNRLHSSNPVTSTSTKYKLS